MNSPGDAACVKTDPYFLLGTSMIFDIERAREINTSVGKWWRTPEGVEIVELAKAFLQASGKLHICTVASLQTSCPVQSKILLLVL